VNASRLIAVCVAILLAGCGGAGKGDGTATLWITRDRGSVVLHEGTVPSGLTALEAVRREAEVETSYGGRYVQAIDGLEGSLAAGRDWFFFVNGVSADRGAAEYRLRAGDVLWWDYRDWQGSTEVAIVVGAFPEPFLHGYDGKRRRAVVRYERPSQAEAARAIGELIGAASVARASTPVPPGVNVFRLVDGGRSFRATSASPGGPYTFTLAGDASRLARTPALVRFRYEGLP
jgi:Domain of unknown function (DUF4430)